MTTNTHEQPSTRSGREAPAGTRQQIPAIALRCSSGARQGHGHASLGDSAGDGPELLVPPQQQGLLQAECSQPTPPPTVLQWPFPPSINQPERHFHARGTRLRSVILHIKKTQFRLNPLARRNQASRVGVLLHMPYTASNFPGSFNELILTPTPLPRP